MNRVVLVIFFVVTTTILGCGLFANDSSSSWKSVNGCRLDPVEAYTGNDRDSARVQMKNFEEAPIRNLEVFRVEQRAVVDTFRFLEDYRLIGAGGPGRDYVTLTLRYPEDKTPQLLESGEAFTVSVKILSERYLVPKATTLNTWWTSGRRNVRYFFACQIKK